MSSDKMEICYNDKPTFYRRRLRYQRNRKDAYDLFYLKQKMLKEDAVEYILNNSATTVRDAIFQKGFSDAMIHTGDVLVGTALLQSNRLVVETMFYLIDSEELNLVRFPRNVFLNELHNAFYCINRDYQDTYATLHGEPGAKYQKQDISGFSAALPGYCSKFFYKILRDKENSCILGSFVEMLFKDVFQLDAIASPGLSTSMLFCSWTIRDLEGHESIKPVSNVVDVRVVQSFKASSDKSFAEQISVFQQFLEQIWTIHGDTQKQGRQAFLEEQQALLKERVSELKIKSSVILPTYPKNTNRPDTAKLYFQKLQDPKAKASVSKFLKNFNHAETDLDPSFLKQYTLMYNTSYEHFCALQREFFAIKAVNPEFMNDVIT